ncbi:unnamed protein product [marine sediment metagenome]|uniref:Uncharacterized protein n=1 Tax=marine sediment metagenome TaxID=412755 RepID=X0ZTP6_9ZZZZ
MANPIPEETRAIFEKALARYRPGGEYGKGVETALERGRTKALATGMQSLVSAGLAGTTMAAGLGKRYEEEVGIPTRARVEETRAERMSAIEMAVANIMQRATEAREAREERERARKAQETLAREQLGAQERTAFYGRREQTRLAQEAGWRERAPWMYGGAPAAPAAPAAEITAVPIFSSC